MTASTSTLSNLRPNPLWSELPLFDRAGWKSMAFGEFAESIGERAEPRGPAEEGKGQYGRPKKLGSNEGENSEFDY